ncbi:MAG: putative DNA binding domain-containing protein, partial [Fibrobacter sp.]|nr:putative DNA binding domain-containing protein [Fibrobacter sp.]
MTLQDLKNIVQCGETSLVQFKEEFTSQKQIASEIVAFANSKGGVILFGIQDKTNSIKGLKASVIQQISKELGNAATEHIRPTVYLTTEVIEVKKNAFVLAAHIKEGSNKPYKDLNGTIWIKQATDKRKLTENNEILALFQESRMYKPETAAVPGTTINDFETAYINDFFQKVYGKDKEDFGKPLSRILTSLDAMKESGEATQAGLLFFGKNPQKYLKTYKIKAVAFYGNDIADSVYQDSRDIEGTIPFMYKEALNFLKSNLKHEQKGQSFNSVGILEISEIALEEILQNALVHIDLLQPASIKILVFQNRIEFINPGSLYNGLTIDSIKMGASCIRNPTIANFCAKILVYRGLGSGILRASKECPNISFFDMPEINQFKVIIWRTDDKTAINEM